VGCCFFCFWAVPWVVCLGVLFDVLRCLVWSGGVEGVFGGVGVWH